MPTLKTDDVPRDEELIKRKNKYAVDSRDIPLHSLQSIYLADQTLENQINLKNEVDERIKIESTF